MTARSHGDFNLEDQPDERRRTLANSTARKERPRLFRRGRTDVDIVSLGQIGTETRV
jgi:hypothetical protein